MSKAVSSARRRMQQYPQAFLQCTGPVTLFLSVCLLCFGQYSSVFFSYLLLVDTKILLIFFFKQAAAYGKCVAVKDNVTKHICDKEFRALKDCIEKAVRMRKKLQCSE